MSNVPVVTAAQPRVEVAGNPDFGHLTCELGPGEALIVEGGAGAYWDDGMSVRSRLMGGFFKALWRRLVAGESLFFGIYEHPRGGRLTVSPSVPGRVVHRALDGDRLMLQPTSFLACTDGVYIGTRFGGLRALFSGEGLFFLECSGRGDLYFNAHGDILEKEVDGSLIVDTGHVVAWEPTLDWRIRGMGNLFSTLFSGEGLVLEFSGRGRVWVQTRHLKGLAGWLRSYLW